MLKNVFKKFKYLFLPVFLISFYFFLFIRPSCGCADVAKSRDSVRKWDLVQLGSGLSEYYKINNKFPNSLIQLSGDYLKSIPTQPITKKQYYYKPLSINNIPDKSYMLITIFEKTKGNLCLSNIDEIGYIVYYKDKESVVEFLKKQKIDSFCRGYAKIFNF